MSYIINNSRGNVIAIVADGTVNTTATDLTLVGRGVTNYGTAESENYVYLLENFANSTAPLLPILGQLWYNSNTDTISAYSSANTWTALASQDYVQAQKISPAFSGIPIAPTAANGTSTTQLATTAFVRNQLQSADSIVASGNITGGNIQTSGTVSATGNITTAGTLIANVVIANTVIANGASAFRLPNLTQTQINALTAANGDMVYNTNSNVPQIYQNGLWKNFTLS